MLADMAARTINGTDELRSLIGEHLGYSDWVEITQDQVNQFADATGDHQWIHVDVERAKAGPFGAPIAHGYLTLSLGPCWPRRSTRSSGFKMGVNYGAEKIRFPSPVPVGSKLRLGAKLLDVTDVAGGIQMKMEFSFEVEGAAKPSLRRRGPLPPLRVRPPATSGRSRNVRAIDLGAKSSERLGVGVVGAPRDEPAAAEVDVGLRSSRRPARACRRGCRPASSRPARPTGCACRRPRPRPRSRG